MKELTKNEKQFTVKEIAEILKVSERTIQRWVEKYFPEKMKNGITTLLNENEITVIKQEMKRNYSLDNAVEVTTDLEMQKRIFEDMQYMLEKIKQQEQDLIKANDKIAIDAPKVEFAETVSSSKDALTFRIFAKILGTGQNRLFEALRAKRILMPDNSPYQRYIDEGYFKVIEKIYIKNTDKNLYSQTLITGKGQKYISKILDKPILPFGKKAIKNK